MANILLSLTVKWIYHKVIILSLYLSHNLLSPFIHTNHYTYTSPLIPIFLPTKSTLSDFEWSGKMIGWGEAFQQSLKNMVSRTRIRWNIDSFPHIFDSARVRGLLFFKMEGWESGQQMVSKMAGGLPRMWAKPDKKGNMPTGWMLLVCYFFVCLFWCKSRPRLLLHAFTLS